MFVYYLEYDGMRTHRHIYIYMYNAFVVWCFAVELPSPYIGEMIVMHVECNDEADLSSFIIKTRNFILISSSITQLFQSNGLNK